MKPEHHALTMEVTIELLDWWRKNLASGVSKKLLAELNNVIYNVHIKRLKQWVAQTDDLEDVVVTEGLARKIIDKVSKATCFQHFAYGGLLEDLRSGNSVIRTYDGYCWDCDPYLKWYEEIANLSWENVKYNENCGIFTPDILKGSPGAKKILGDQDWDDQIYPSAIELSQFYGEISIKQKDNRQYSDIQSLCFAIHLLHDLAVPHHVLCTIEKDHSGYEQDIYDFWKFIYSERSTYKKEDVLKNQLSDAVLSLLNSDLSKANSFTEIGKWAVDNTCQWLKDSVFLPPEPTKNVALRITQQGIACTIKAFSLYLGEKNILV